MFDVQITLTIVLLFIEIVAFAWLIIDMRKSKQKQNKIIELEHQILLLEESIIDQEKNIISEIKELKEIVKKKK
jgi:CHASE3 domain sensor protein